MKLNDTILTVMFWFGGGIPFPNSMNNDSIKNQKQLPLNDLFKNCLGIVLTSHAYWNIETETSS